MKDIQSLGNKLVVGQLEREIDEAWRDIQTQYRKINIAGLGMLASTIVGFLVTFNPIIEIAYDSSFSVIATVATLAAVLLSATALIVAQVRHDKAMDQWATLNSRLYDLERYTF